MFNVDERRHITAIEDLTMDDLNELDIDDFIELKTRNEGSYIAVTVERGENVKTSQWRKITAAIRKSGFHHIKGQSEWFATYK
jgi:hypothetical protein